MFPTPHPVRPRTSKRLLGRGIAATVVAGLAVAAVAGAGPASAAGNNGSTSVTLSANGANTNGRTLVLTDLTGTSLSTASGLTASSGSSGFITGVADNNYTNNGYTVQATMTNLYKKTGSTYDCSDFIPSNDVSVAQNGALDLTNIAATVQPVFNLAGTILGAIPLGPSTPLTGIANSLNATTLLGSANAALATDGTLSGLPVKALRGSNATFTNPATFGLTDCGAAAGATTPVLISGTANPGGLKGILSALLGGTASAQSLISAGYATLDAVKLAVAPLVTGGLAVLNALNISQITGVVNTLQQITQSGTYKVSPTLNVNIPASANGNYVGVMTVTLADV